jgi:hypothetical protein
VLSAAILNALAGLLTIRIVSRLLPNQKIIALMGGVVTACWFQAPFGTMWLEQTAFFFCLLALDAVTVAELTNNRRLYGLHFLGGLLMAISTLSKQNAGALFLPVIGGVGIIGHLHEPRAALKRVGTQASGYLLGVGCFLLWLWRYSDPSKYFHYSVEITCAIAAERTPGTSFLVETLLTLSSAPLHVRWCELCFALVGVCAALAALGVSSRSKAQTQNHLMAGWIIVACLQFQQLFTLVSYNEAENNLPFLGLAFGLAMGLLSDWLGHDDLQLSLSSGKGVFQATLPRRAGRCIVLIASVVLFAIPIRWGVRTSWRRYVQEFTDASRFTGTLSIAGLRGLKWADFEFPAGPLDRGSSQWLRENDFTALNDWLERNPGNIFVFPDATILYGLHRRPSPQPWLYFQEGHSFLRSDLPIVDETVVQSLRRNGIRAVILEKVAWNSDHLLERMPKLKAWINDNFTKETEFGIFEVWKEKSGQ